MGSGKTYWGRRLSEQLDIPFVDLDQQIEAAEAMSVSAIFQEKGEEGFRLLERHHLQQSAAIGPHILATGGGTPCFFDNMAWMMAHGCTVFLDTPVDVLAARLRLDKTVRPLLQGVPEHELEDKIAQLLLKRASCYEKAHIRTVYSEDNDAFLSGLLRQIQAF